MAAWIEAQAGAQGHGRLVLAVHVYVKPRKSQMKRYDMHTYAHSLHHDAYGSFVVTRTFFLNTSSVPEYVKVILMVN